MGGEGLLSEFPFGRICRMDGDMDSLYVSRGGRLVGWLLRSWAREKSRTRGKMLPLSLATGPSFLGVFASLSCFFLPFQTCSQTRR